MLTGDFHILLGAPLGLFVYKMGGFSSFIVIIGVFWWFLLL